MPELRTLRIETATRYWRRGLLALGLAAVALLSAPAQAPGSASTVTLDRVVAVVNRRAILVSDIEDEFRISVLDPSRAGSSDMTPQQALQRLISRTLIQQQIRQEDMQATEPTTEEIAARLNEIRNQLPACVRSHCSSDAGWKAFLADNDLTPERVDTYLRNRIEILRFIELRFRQGIRIAPEEVEGYYREKLLPLYPPGQTPPPLDQVAPRIEEILLQQQVNVLFDDWLDNLQKQGEIEVLDPALQPAKDQNNASGTSATIPGQRSAPDSGFLAANPGHRSDTLGASRQ
jgi:peptidyl-prolyl cis-trans isomerase SurA